MKFALLAALLGLAACAFQTGPPTSGADSSAPTAVSTAHGGSTGGGANVFNQDDGVID